MNYLLTYDDAQEMCKRYDNFNFSEKSEMINGYKVSTFSYFLCKPEHFYAPLPERPEVKAFDMRGSTFIFNKNGTLFERYFMLPKFFNLNQTEQTQYDALKDMKLKYAVEKADGSLVAFMRLPNEKLFCKTINGFNNEQATNAYNLLYSNEEWVKWVKTLLNFKMVPLFEYVGLDNRIVLTYGKREIRFLGARRFDKFVPAAEFERIPKGLRRVKSFISSLDEVVEESLTAKDIEGWVLHFENGDLGDFLVKVKTEWYFNIHYARTENIFHEHYIIKNYLDEKLDDITQVLNKDDDADAFEFINKVTTAVDKGMKDIDDTVLKMKKDYETSGLSWGDFAKLNNKLPFFAYFTTYVKKDREVYNEFKIGMVKKECFKLERARKFVEKYA